MSPLLTACLVVGLLWVAKAILIPFALAFYLAFVLTPPLKRLERAGVPRLFSVFLTVALMLSALGGLGLVLAYQVNDLSSQLVKYTVSMRQKVADLREGHGGPLDLLQRSADRVLEELDDKGADVREAAPVRVVPGPSGTRDRLLQMAAPIAQGVGFVGIVLVLVVFMLSRQEDLRDRLIGLAGRGRVTLATRTMDEAVERVSRFLLALSLINVGVGVIVAAGLSFIGVPYALLWGFLAAVLRFVPYVGSLVATALPSLLVFAMFPGWTHLLQTILVFVATDVLAAYFAEPVLVGHRTGVSSLALLVSSIFWAWLWGPLGLVLSTPLTVCIAVVGRHVPQLAFLDVLLGDHEALEPEVRFYQRLLAGDETEAAQIAYAVVRAKGWPLAMDEVLIPALGLATSDRDQNAISAEDLTRVQTSARAVLKRLEKAHRKHLVRGQGEVIRALGIGAYGTGDGLLMDLLALSLRPANVELEVLTSERDPEAILREAQRRRPRLVFVGSLPPVGGAKARYLCRRLKVLLPTTPVTVLRPAQESEDPARSSAALREAGADDVVKTLGAALEGWSRLLRSQVGGKDTVRDRGREG